jgi:hypothetical protein
VVPAHCVGPSRVPESGIGHDGSVLLKLTDPG